MLLGTKRGRRKQSVEVFSRGRSPILTGGSLFMSERNDFEHVCPFLGLAEDRYARFSYPEAAHLCFAAGRKAPIALEHQSAFCLTLHHPACPRYVEPLPEEASTPAPSPSAPETKTQEAAWLPRWGIVLGGLTGLLVLFIIFYGSRFVLPSSSISSEPTLNATPSPTASLTATSIPTQEVVESTSTPAPVAFLSVPTSTPTPVPGDQIYALSPAASDIGWVTSGEERGNHFGDSFLYAGVLDGQAYHAAFQFDLGSIPRGAPIHYGVIQLTGLRGDRLGTGGAWTLRLLAPEIDQNWRRHAYQDIFNAPALQTLIPILGEPELAVGQTNVFELSPDQVEILETRIIEDEDPKVSFRIDGPLTGPDNLFAWDTGYGPKSRGDKVTLLLSVGQPPATPPPYDYVVVTSTPTPENVLTAGAIVLQMTADAARIGTATPVPPNVVTATPVPEYLVILPTPTPENEATAQAMAVRATAEALTTGTPVPPPTNAMTATPTPSPTPAPTYVLITATPTPDSIFAAATLSAAATFRAERLGAPTPLPANWVTPIVVTSTPAPANAATAQALAMLATAQAVTTGTPTPTPANMVTATSTPVFILLDGELPPMIPTPTPTLAHTTMPPALMGRIAFKSDRTGQEEIYVINPDGSGLALLSDRWPYDLALERDKYSSDERFQVFVKDALIDTAIDDSRGGVTAVQLRVPSLFFFDAHYEVEEQITHFGAGIAYDPAWSPVSEQMVFVSDDSGNDEIWVINRDGTGARQLTRNEWEWDKHPSWSPDGNQIVFWSNRTGNWQIWVMDADGGNLYSLSRGGFNDWDPVWIKYPGISGYQAEP